MSDREKVIKGLEMCDIYTGDLCSKNNCPYFWDGCRDKLKKNILAMLKEQEEQIEQLEHDLAVTENNINYYINGND